VSFFLCGGVCVFAGVFTKLWCENVVFWMVKRGEIVVECWLQTPRFPVTKNTPRFSTLFFLSRQAPDSSKTRLPVSRD
jgi:hypothetical protein